MKNTAIMSKLRRTACQVGFTIKQHSPEILVIGGVTGVIVSAVMACRATTKMTAIVAKTKEQEEIVKKGVEDGEVVTETGIQSYTEEDAKSDIRIYRAKAGLEIAKVYAPAVVIGALSITSILASNNILRKRNVALAAAYAAVDKSFKEYQNRVIERFGENVNRELKYNIQTKKVEETVTDEETGKTKKVKTPVEVTDGNLLSPYARFFDAGNPNWEKDADYNFMFLRAEQNWANDKLRADGHLFWNDVLVRLGFDKCPEGQIVGWVYDGTGDNYVDFGICDMKRERTRAFIEGYEPTIILDFNVDGDIWSLMKDPKYHNKFTAM